MMFICHEKLFDFPFQVENLASSDIKFVEVLATNHDIFLSKFGHSIFSLQGRIFQVNYLLFFFVASFWDWMGCGSDFVLCLCH